MSLGNTVKFMALIAGMFCFQSFFVGDETMTKEDGMYTPEGVYQEEQGGAY